MELGVGEHGEIGSERANDAVSAESYNAIIVVFQATKEFFEVRLGLVLRQRCQR